MHCHRGNNRSCDQDPIRNGINDLAKFRDLIESSSNESIEVIGYTEHGQQPASGNKFVFPKEQPEVNRKQAQPHDRDDIWHGQEFACSHELIRHGLRKSPRPTCTPVR